MGQPTTPRPARLTRPTHAQNPGTDASTGGRGGEAPGGAATDDPSRSGSADGIRFRVGDWNCGTFSLRQANRQLCRTGSHGRVQRRSAPIGTHQQARQLTASLFAGRRPQWRSKFFHLAMRRGRKIAKVAMARKLAVYLYWMWRQGWDYEQLQKFGPHAGQPENRDGVQ